MDGIAIGLLVPFLGTVIGASFVFFMRHEMNVVLQKSLLGFASGVMVAASFWSLLLPSLDFTADAEGIFKVLPSAVGFLLGIGFLLAIHHFTPHFHIGDDHPEGMKSGLSRTTMLSLAVTIHNLPEGMAVGVVLSGFLSGDMGINAMAALTMSVGIAFRISLREQ